MKKTRKVLSFMAVFVLVITIGCIGAFAAENVSYSDTNGNVQTIVSATELTDTSTMESRVALTGTATVVNNDTSDAVVKVGETSYTTFDQTALDATAADAVIEIIGTISDRLTVNGSRTVYVTGNGSAAWLYMEENSTIYVKDGGFVTMLDTYDTAKAYLQTGGSVNELYLRGNMTPTVVIDGGEVRSQLVTASRAGGTLMLKSGKVATLEINSNYCDTVITKTGEITINTEHIVNRAWSYSFTTDYTLALEADAAVDAEAKVVTPAGITTYYKGYTSDSGTKTHGFVYALNDVAKTGGTVTLLTETSAESTFVLGTSIVPYTIEIAEGVVCGQITIPTTQISVTLTGDGTVTKVLSGFSYVSPEGAQNSLALTGNLTVDTLEYYTGTVTKQKTVTVTALTGNYVWAEQDADTDILVGAGAKIVGGACYQTLEEALAAAKQGDTVQLLMPRESVVMDTYGVTLLISADVNTLTVADGTVNIQKGTIGTVSVSGGTLNVLNAASYVTTTVNALTQTGGTVSISGGMFGFEPAADWLADYYHAVPMAGGTKYIVVNTSTLYIKEDSFGYVYMDQTPMVSAASNTTYTILGRVTNTDIMNRSNVTINIIDGADLDYLSISDSTGVVINISGGTIQRDINVTNSDVTYNVTGGTFLTGTTQPSYPLADGYYYEALADQSGYEVKAYAFKVADQYYKTYAEAVAAIRNMDNRMYILAEVQEDITARYQNGTTFTIYVMPGGSVQNLTLLQGVGLALQGGHIETLTIRSDAYTAAVVGFDVTLESGTLDQLVIQSLSYVTVTKDAAMDIAVPATYFWKDGKTLTAYVALVGNVGYETLSEALAAAHAGDTVTLITEQDTVTMDKDGVTLHLEANVQTLNYTAGTVTKASNVQVGFIPDDCYWNTTNTLTRFTAADVALVEDMYGLITVYTDVATALESAPAGAAVSLLQNAELTRSVTVTHAVRLHLNNFTLSGDGMLVGEGADAQLFISGPGNCFVNVVATTQSLNSSNLILTVDGAHVSTVVASIGYVDLHNATIDDLTITNCENVKIVYSNIGRLNVSESGTFAYVLISNDSRVDELTVSDGHPIVEKYSSATVTAPDGYVWVDTGNGTELLQVATVRIDRANGDRLYCYTLHDALAAAGDEDIIVLLEHTISGGPSEVFTVAAGTKRTIDLNTHTLNSPTAVYGELTLIGHGGGWLETTVTVYDGGKLTVTEDCAGSTLVMDGENATATITTGSSVSALTLNAGTVKKDFGSLVTIPDGYAWFYEGEGLSVLQIKADQHVVVRVEDMNYDSNVHYYANVSDALANSNPYFSTVYIFGDAGDFVLNTEHYVIMEAGASAQTVTVRAGSFAANAGCEITTLHTQDGHIDLDCRVGTLHVDGSIITLIGGHIDTLTYAGNGHVSKYSTCTITTMPQDYVWLQTNSAVASLRYILQAEAKIRDANGDIYYSTLDYAISAASPYAVIDLLRPVKTINLTKQVTLNIAYNVESLTASTGTIYITDGTIGYLDVSSDNCTVHISGGTIVSYSERSPVRMSPTGGTFLSDMAPDQISPKHGYGFIVVDGGYRVVSVEGMEARIGNIYYNTIEEAIATSKVMIRVLSDIERPVILNQEINLSINDGITLNLVQIDSNINVYIQGVNGVGRISTVQKNSGYLELTNVTVDNLNAHGGQVMMGDATTIENLSVREDMIYIYDGSVVTTISEFTGGTVAKIRNHSETTVPEGYVWAYSDAETAYLMSAADVEAGVMDSTGVTYYTTLDAAIAHAPSGAVIEQLKPIANITLNRSDVTLRITKDVTSLHVTDGTVHIQNGTIGNVTLEGGEVYFFGGIILGTVPPADVQLGDGMVFTPAEGGFTVGIAARMQAMIGNVYYPLLTTALEAADPDQTVHMLRDVDLSGENLILDQEMYVNLSIYTLTVESLTLSRKTGLFGSGKLNGKLIVNITSEYAGVDIRKIEIPEIEIIRCIASIQFQGTKVTTLTVSDSTTGIMLKDWSSTPAHIQELIVKDAFYVVIDNATVESLVYTGSIDGVVEKTDAATVNRVNSPYIWNAENTLVRAAAYIGDVYYETIEEALANADKGVITLCRDAGEITITEITVLATDIYEIDKLNLLGGSVSLIGDGTVHELTVTDGSIRIAGVDVGTLTVTGGSVHLATGAVGTLVVNPDPLPVITKGPDSTVQPPDGYAWLNDTLTKVGAMIGDVPYATLSDAVNAAVDGDVIDMVCSHEGDELNIQVSMKIRLNGYTYVIHDTDRRFTYDNKSFTVGIVVRNSSVFLTMENGMVAFTGMSTTYAYTDTILLLANGPVILTNVALDSTAHMPADSDKTQTALVLNHLSITNQIKDCTLTGIAAPATWTMKSGRVVFDHTTVNGDMQITDMFLTLQNGTHVDRIVMPADAGNSGRIIRTADVTVNEIPEGYLWYLNNNGTYTLTKGVAKVGTTYYATLEDALANSTSGLPANLTGDLQTDNLTLHENAYLNIGNYTLTIDELKVTSVFTLSGTNGHLAGKMIIDINGMSGTRINSVTIDEMDVFHAPLLNLTNVAISTLTVQEGYSSVYIANDANRNPPETHIGELIVSGGYTVTISGGTVDTLTYTAGTVIKSADATVTTINAEGYDWCYNQSDPLTQKLAIPVACDDNSTLYATAEDALDAVDTIGGNVYLMRDLDNVLLNHESVTLHTMFQNATQMGRIEVQAGELIVTDCTMDTLQVSGGSVQFKSGAVTHLNVTGGSVAFTGGKILSGSTLPDLKYLADGYCYTPVAGGFMVAHSSRMDARIGDVYYFDIQLAYLSASEGATITLLKDVTFDQRWDIQKNVTVDLDGKTMTCPDTLEFGIAVFDGTLTIRNGQLVTAGTAGVYLLGYGKLVMEDVDMVSTADYSIILYEHASVDLKAVTMTVTAGATAIYMGDDTALTVDSETVIWTSVHAIQISSKAELHFYGTIRQTDSLIVAIMGIGGNDTVPGTTIHIYEGSHIDVNRGYAVYHPQMGTLHIYGGTITASTGIELRAGTLNISGGTITATDSFATQANAGGTSMVGVGIGISQHISDQPISVNISGGQISGAYALYEEDLLNDLATDKISMKITGGTFTSTEAEYTAVSSENVTGFISGGTFSTLHVREYYAEGYVPMQTAANVYTTVAASEVAAVVSNDTYSIGYTTANQAISEARADDLVTLMNDAESMDIAAGQEITLNLGGKTVRGTITVNGGKLTVIGEGAVTGTLHAPAGTVEIKSGDFTACTLSVVGFDPDHFPSIRKADTVDLTPPENYGWDSEGYLVDAIFMLNGQLYGNLAAAIANAQGGDTITLLMNASGGGVVIPAGKFTDPASPLTIDLAGFTYTISGGLVGSSGTATNGMQLLKNNYVTFTNGAIAGTAQNLYILIQNYANLTLDDVDVDASGNAGTAYALSINNGDVNIQNGSTITAAEGKVAFDIYAYTGYTGGTVRLTDSVINGQIEFDADDAWRGETGRQLVITGSTVNGTIRNRLKGNANGITIPLINFIPADNGHSLTVTGLTETVVYATFVDNVWILESATFAGETAVMTFAFPESYTDASKMMVMQTRIEDGATAKYVYHADVADSRVVIQNTVGFSRFELIPMTETYEDGSIKSVLHLDPGETLTYTDREGKQWVITAPSTSEGNHDDLAVSYYPAYDRYAVGTISYTTLDAYKVYGTDKWYPTMADLLAETNLMPGTGSYEFNAYMNTFDYTVADDNDKNHFTLTPSTRTDDGLLYWNRIDDGKHYLDFTIIHVSATSVYELNQDCFIIDDTGAGDIVITQAPITNNYGEYKGELPYNGSAQSGDFPVVGDFAFSTQHRDGIDGPIAVKFSLTEPANPADESLYGLTVAPSVTNFKEGIITVWYIAYDTGEYVNYAPAYGTYTITITKLDITHAVFELIEDSFIYNGVEQSVSIKDGKVTLIVNGQEFTLIKDTDYTISGDKETNAGNHTFTITAVADSNYDLFATRAWTIAQRELYVVPYNHSVIYGHDYEQRVPAWEFFHNYETTEWIAAVSQEYVTLSTYLTTATDYVVGDGVDMVRNISIVYAEGKSADDHPNFKLILDTAAFAEVFGFENVSDHFGTLTILPDKWVGIDFSANFDRLVFNGEIQQPVLNNLIVTKYDFNTADDIHGEVIDIAKVAVAEVNNRHAGTYMVILTILDGNYEGAQLVADYTITPMVIKDVEWIFAEEGYTYNGEMQGPEAIAYGPNDTVLKLSTTGNIFVGDYWSYVEGILTVSNQEHLITDYVLDLLSIRVASYEIREAVDVKFDSAFVAIGDTYALSFIMPKLALEQYNLTAADADDLFEVFYNGSRKFASANEYTFQPVGNEYILTYAQIAPSNMGKPVTVTPVFGKDPQVIEYSIAQYCYDMFAIYDDDAVEGNLYYDFVKMIVSLLNYGHAAEVYATGSSKLMDSISDETLEKYGIERAEKPDPDAEPTTPPTTTFVYNSEQMKNELKANLSFALGSAPSITLTYELPAGMTAADLKIGFIDKTTGAVSFKTANDTNSMTFTIPLSNADHEFCIGILDANTNTTYMMVDVTLGHFGSGNSADMNAKMSDFAAALAIYLEWMNESIVNH